MTPDQLINQDSGNVEFYTPAKVLKYVHQMFSVVGLDPASNSIANKSVRAMNYFTKEDDALTQKWIANTVWLNHPFNKGELACKPKCVKKICNDPSYHKYRGHCITEDIASNGDWIDYYLEQFALGHFKEAMNITFVNSSEAWCQKLLNAGLSCFIDGRTHFNDPQGNVKKGAPKGCFITYLGDRTDEFRKIFSALGVVK
ncbi:DNA N-6-adenine-methyltransferase [Pseudoalteromonas sp. SD03]|uniref:DNA N-6-adenine-methyltransferase n=1 Tax=Pseudoalteromonas sp. SD03 TaxID=3231719 RepID=A0AB39ATR3_9GAMM